MAPHGYAWWYVDAISDDGRHGLTLIAFIGSVFSPYYATARRRGRGFSENHCALNVALYGARSNRWSMTERGRAALARDTSTLAIGPSSLRWDGEALTIEIAEISVPVPRRVRGTVRVIPRAMTDHAFELDAQGVHRWHPIAPVSRVEVAMTTPSIRWAGDGYLDTNAGEEPLEDGFVKWNWCRGHAGDAAALVYDSVRRDGTRRVLSLSVDRSGRIEEREPPAESPVPATPIWRFPRTPHAEPGHRARVSRTFEDTPFYARSLIETRLFGQPMAAVHESLSLDRFRAPWVQLMLPFRMPRRGG